MRRVWTNALAVLAIGISLGAPYPAAAFRIEVASDQFSSQMNVYSGVTGFSITIEVVGPLRTGLFDDPELDDIEFLVTGSLAPSTPARTANPNFRGFAVDDRAALRGQAFYDQGNSLRFEVSAGADLSDGLQVSEAVGSGLVFEFDGHEDDTGRYHPPILQLFGDGTGSIRNSDNTGGINPFTQVEVNAVVGDEYITDLVFEPTSFTLVAPEPSTGLLVGLGLAALSARRGRPPRRGRV